MQNEGEDVEVDEGMYRLGIVDSRGEFLRILLQEVREDGGGGVDVFSVLEEGEGLVEIGGCDNLEIAGGEQELAVGSHYGAPRID